MVARKHNRIQDGIFLDSARFVGHHDQQSCRTVIFDKYLERHAPPCHFPVRILDSLNRLAFTGKHLAAHGNSARKLFKGFRLEELEQAFVLHVLAAVQEIDHISTRMKNVKILVRKDNRKVVAFPQKCIEQGTGIHAVVQIALDITTEKNMGKKGSKSHHQEHGDGDHAEYRRCVVFDTRGNPVVLTHVDNIERQMAQRSHHENELLAMFIRLFEAQDAPIHQCIGIELVRNQLKQIFDAILQDLSTIGLVREIGQEVVVFAPHQHRDAAFFLGKPAHRKTHLVKIDIFGDGTLELVILIPNRIRKRKHLLVHIFAENRPRVGKSAFTRCFQVPARRAEFRLPALKFQSATRNEIAVLASVIDIDNPFAPLLRLLVKHGPKRIVLRYLLKAL